MTVNILYLHGFGSSPASKKANLFRAPLEALGANYLVPDLNVPSFETLTLSAMLERTAEAVSNCPDGPVFLVGSSMGGLTALHFTDRYRDSAAKRVEKLVLLAPAFAFLDNRRRQDADLLDQWQREGHYPFFNYLVGEMRPVHYGLVEDSRRYDSYAVNLELPMLIYHGRQDESVDYRQSERFADGRPNVTLRLLESDHQLLDQTDTILAGMIAFFGIKAG